MRRSETDFFMEQSHDVVAWLQVRELGPDGQYVPVPVVSQGNLDPGAFSLHQGLQRRLVLTMTSNSGRQLPWTDVVKTKVGNVRLLDAKGRVHESSSRPLAHASLTAKSSRGIQTRWLWFFVRGIVVGLEHP
jgi:kinesin family protein 1